MNNLNGNNPITPLLRRTQLLSGESLPSLLERLVQCNYYPNTGTLARICAKHLKCSTDRDNLVCPSRVETFVQMAQLMGISPDALFNASQHRFASFLIPRQPTPMEMECIDGESKLFLSPLVAKKHLHPASVAHYCPMCLKISAYHHLSWTLMTTTVCLEHLCLLVKACPHCGKHLSVLEVVKRRCGACWADLCAAEVVFMGDDALGIGMQRVLYDWLWDIDPNPEWFASCGFPAVSPDLLYHLLENLIWQMLACHREWSVLPDPFHGLAGDIPSVSRRLDYLSPRQMYALFRAAFLGIMNWPVGLFQVLDACAGYFVLTLTVSSRLKRLETIQRQWSQPAWQGTEYGFLKKAFADYLLTHDLVLTG